MKYAGIGARVTPQPVLLEMGNIAMRLALAGYTLRSGAAAGADTAFERGCDLMRGSKVIRCPTLYGAALAHASRFHPNWSACSEAAQALHARNSLVIMGDKFDDPVSFVVCWTESAAIIGGTGQALRIAEFHSIPVFNLAANGAANRLWEFVGP